MRPLTSLTQERILLLGDPRLRRVAPPVSDLNDAHFRTHGHRLQETLSAFRRERGFGRAIAATQIGIPLRFIAVNLNGREFLVINPVITWRSPQMFTMWDDCMSFPDLLVRVERHTSLSLRYLDEHGAQHHWEQLGQAESELIQHEMDHLDGTLAIDRALDRDSFVMREQFMKMPNYFLGRVDYVIDGYNDVELF